MLGRKDEQDYSREKIITWEDNPAEGRHWCSGSAYILVGTLLYIVYVPPNSCIELLTLKGMVFGGRTLRGDLDRMVDPSWMGLVLLKKRPWDLRHNFHHMRTLKEGTIYKPESRSSQDTKAGALILESPDSRSVRSKFCFLSYPVYGIFAIAARND